MTLLQEASQCVEELVDVVAADGAAHVADADHLVVERAKAGGDLDVMGLGQVANDLAES